MRFVNRRAKGRVKLSGCHGKRWAENNRDNRGESESLAENSLDDDHSATPMDRGPPKQIPKLTAQCWREVQLRIAGRAHTLAGRSCDRAPTGLPASIASLTRSSQSEGQAKS